MIKVTQKAKRNANWKQYESDYMYQTANYFDKKVPELDKMSNKQLQVEFVAVRKSLMEKSKILYLYKRSVSGARRSGSISQVGVIRWGALTHWGPTCTRVLKSYGIYRYIYAFYCIRILRISDSICIICIWTRRSNWWKLC